jgi:hypothetical protein
LILTAGNTLNSVERILIDGTEQGTVALLQREGIDLNFMNADASSDDLAKQ